MDAERFDYLINGYFDGQLSPAERDELDALVISDSRAREAYWQFAVAHADLRVWGEQRAAQIKIAAADGLVGKQKSASRPRLPSMKTWGLIALAGSLFFALLFAWVHFRSAASNHAAPSEAIAAGNQPEARREVSIPGGMAPAQGSPATQPAAVARLVHSYDCVWTDSETPLADGDRLRSGQSLELRTGLAEIVFDCQARVILQGPASFLLDSTRSASLSYGKITVKAEAASAKGFLVRTPSMKTIDLGTEFGLEVAPTGVEQVHVFRGEVQVSGGTANGPTVPSQRLAQEQGIEVDPNTEGVKLVVNNGERFARSLDDAKKNRHVVAHWRFEDHAVGVLVPESKAGQNPVRGSLDSSINGNDLYSWNQQTQPRFSGDVPAATVPQTGDKNSASLDNTVPPQGLATRDLFTMSYWSHPSFTDLQTITPAQWTIEASIKLAELPDRFQTFLVRDGIKACSINPSLPPLAFQVTPDRHVKVLFCDVDRRFYEATAVAVTVQKNHWYHVAATSDGKTLRLYVDSLDGKGYCLWAATGLATEGSTALGRGSFDTNNPAVAAPGGGYPYIWSVGRGFYAGGVTEWFRGWIDEVRICDVALEPAAFLFAAPSNPEAQARRAFTSPLRVGLRSFSPANRKP